MRLAPGDAKSTRPRIGLPAQGASSPADGVRLVTRALAVLRAPGVIRTGVMSRVGVGHPLQYRCQGDGESETSLAPAARGSRKDKRLPPPIVRSRRECITRCRRGALMCLRGEIRVLARTPARTLCASLRRVGEPAIRCPPRRAPSVRLCAVGIAHDHSPPACTGSTDVSGAASSWRSAMALRSSTLHRL